MITLIMIDTHAHLTVEPLVQQADALALRARERGVEKVVNICIDADGLEKGVALAERHPWIFNAAATTPHDVEKEGETFFPLVEQNLSKLVAIGETGLDYFYTHSPKETQQKFFRRYLSLAKKSGLPLIFHCRDAFHDLFAIADEVAPHHPAILHCFTGTLEEALQGVARGWMISFSGIITFKKSEALREVVKQLPLENLLVETDAPYLAPQSRRGSTNEPAYIHETVEKIAEVRCMSAQEIAKITTANAIKFFPFSKVQRGV
ncbi:MAG: TatD family hydrolase [Chlamydiales bacterium]